MSTETERRAANGHPAAPVVSPRPVPSFLVRVEERTPLPPVSVVVPAYNEAGGVAAQVAAVRQALRAHDVTHEIIVVDDGSRDATGDEAARADATVVRHPRNRGYGAALKSGIRAATHETIVIIDADGTYPADMIPTLIPYINDYDMVVGARIGSTTHIPLARRPAKWFLRQLASYLTGEAIPDLNSGLRVMKKPLVERFEYILPSGFSFTTTITLSLLCNDFSVYYHPINYYRRTGSSKIRPVDAYHFLLLILRTIVYFNPLKVFLPLGAFLFLGGLGKFIYDLFIGNLSETAVLGFLAAFIVWAIGLLSDQIARLGFHMRASG